MTEKDTSSTIRDVYYAIATISLIVGLFLAVYSSPLDEKWKYFGYGALVIAICAIVIYLGILQPRQKQIVRAHEVEKVEEPEVLYDETRIIKEGEYLVYEIPLDKDDLLNVNILARDGPVDVFVLADKDFTKFEQGKKFSWEEKQEDVMKIEFPFIAPKNGIWVVVVRNPEEESIAVGAKISVS